MAEFMDLCPASEIGEGERDVFEVNGRWVAVFRVSDKYYAVEDLCTHDGNVLTEDKKGRQVPLDGYEIECPRHGARFDIRTGRVLSAPALVDIPFFETRVEVGMLQIKA